MKPPSPPEGRPAADSRLRRWLRRRLLKNFAFVWHAQTALQRRFTANGQFVLIATGLAAMLGLNTRQALAYQLFSLLCSCLFFSVLFSSRLLWRKPPPLRVQRVLSNLGSVGADAHYHFAIENQGQQDLHGWSILEAPHDPAPNLAQFMHALEPGADTRNGFDRAVGYYRWAWLLHMNRISRFGELMLPTLAAGANTLVAHCFRPYARGNLVLRGIWLAQRDPFGLCRRLYFLPLPGHVLVLPPTRPISLPPLASSRHAQHEQARSISGDGEEFAGLRPFRQGDSLRLVHWKSFARSGHLVVREFQAEFFTRHALLLDTVLAPAGQAFEEAIALCASLLLQVHGQTGSSENLLDLFYLDTTVQRATCGRGQLQVEALLQILAGVQASRYPALPQLQQAVLAAVPEFSACMCVFLHWDPARAAFCARLRESGLPFSAWLVAATCPPDCPPWLQYAPVAGLPPAAAA